MDKFYTTAFGGFAAHSDQERQEHESRYIEKYRENLREIAKNRSWKSGHADVFGGGAANNIRPENLAGSVIDVSAYRSGQSIYSAAVGEVSGIIRVDPAAGENYLIHSNQMVFGSLEYDEDAGCVVTSVAKGGASSDIAVYDERSGDLRVLTGGDSADEYPSFSKTENRILYSSRGIGRTVQMEFAGFADSEILSIGPAFDIREELTEPGYDLYAPKNDAKGNLFYLKKASKRKRNTTGKTAGRFLLDILLLPFWIVFGLLRLLMYLAALSKPKTDGAQNGAMDIHGGGEMARLRAEQSKLHICGEEIDLTKADKKRKKDESGYAPDRLELWVKASNGERTKVKSGVLSFDVHADGTVLYTDGRNVFTVAPSGETVRLCREKLAVRARLGTPTQSAYRGFEPFS